MNAQIIVKRAYFDNIKLTIDAINDFFASQCKTKNFPSIESDTDIDIIIGNIVELLNNVEPSWIDDQEKVDNILTSINDTLENEKNISSYEESSMAEKIFAYIGYRVLQFISENFDSFSELMNGIYTFELFMDPDKYYKVIDKFTQPIDLSELVLNVSEESEIHLFDIETYVNGIFSNKEYVEITGLDKDEEIDRMNQKMKCTKAEIIVDDRKYDDVDDEDEEVHQEAAEINLFEEDKPKHIKYDEKKDKFTISSQFKECVDSMLKSFEACENLEDLRDIFKESKIKKTTIEMLAENLSPFVLNKVFNSSKKYGTDTSDIEDLRKYIDSYSSIKEKNKGAERFYNYDVFSTFKVDKEGTIQFLKDFLTCELYNKEDVLISNNTLLTIFNIFDSRIYFDKLYNIIPDNIKKEKYQTEDGFVKKVRSRINKISHAVKVYDDEKADDPNRIKSAEEVQEFVYKTMKKLRDCSTTDMANVELFSDMVYADISLLDNKMYNESMSPIAYSNIIQEMEMGNIPEYMKDRLNISDRSPDDVTVSQAEVSEDPNSAPVPENSFDDLATSIDTKINSFDSGNVDDMLGYGYEERKESSDGKIVYNITYNYSNSFNKNSGNTMNDSSSGKTVTINNTNSNNDSSTTNVHHQPSDSKSNPQMDINIDDLESSTNNSNNNSKHTKDTITSNEDDINSHIAKNDENMPSDELESPDHLSDDIDYKNSMSYDQDKDTSDDKFSTGMTMNEFFTFFNEVAEPLSNSMGTVKNNQQAEMPKENKSTHILDIDLKRKKKRDERKNRVTAAFQPITKIKREIKKAVDSLIKRDENAVKNEILENHDYRHSLQKIARFCIKAGLISVAFTINGYVGSAVLIGAAAREIDKKERVTKEVQSEFATEIEIMDSRIAKAEHIINTAADKAERDKAYQDKWQLMRLKSKMVNMMTDNATYSGHIKTSKQVAF